MATLLCTWGHFGWYSVPALLFSASVQSQTYPYYLTSGLDLLGCRYRYGKYIEEKELEGRVWLTIYPLHLFSTANYIPDLHTAQYIK